MNALNVIAPYRYHGMWVFDDPRVGLVHEPFVAGADTMLDRVTADIPEANKGFLMVFSATPFPGHQFKLEWRRADSGGNWYYSTARHGRLALPRAVQILRARSRGDLHPGEGERELARELA